MSLQEEEEEEEVREKRDSPHTQDLLLPGRLLKELFVELKVSGWVPRIQEEGAWGGEATSVPRLMGFQLCVTARRVVRLNRKE